MVPRKVHKISVRTVQLVAYGHPDQTQSVLPDETVEADRGLQVPPGGKLAPPGRVRLGPVFLVQEIVLLRTKQDFSHGILRDLGTTYLELNLGGLF